MYMLTVTTQMMSSKVLAMKNALVTPNLHRRIVETNGNRMINLLRDVNSLFFLFTSSILSFE